MASSAVFYLQLVSSMKFFAYFMALNSYFQNIYIDMVFRAVGLI